MTHPLSATALGYPRIGPDRELKKAVEAYWSSAGSAEDREVLADAAESIATSQIEDLRGAGLSSVPCNVFSLYDHVLDAAVSLDAIPPRHRELGLNDVDTYFAMARGSGDVSPLELTKWFDTNYHYLVPELAPDTQLRARPDKPLAEFRAAGAQARPVLLGPVTFLLLSKAAPQAPDGFQPLDLLDQVVECYLSLLNALAAAGAEWVQLDEPAFNLDRSEAELAALRRAYRRILAAENRPKVCVAGGYGEFGDALPVLLSEKVEGIALDLASGAGDVERLAAHAPLRDTFVLAGLVDGRNIWRTDRARATAQLGTLLGLVDHIGVSTSCSLLHVPVDVTRETELDPMLRQRLAFARQKLDEVTELAASITTGHDGQAPQQAPPTPTEWHDSRVRGRLSALRPQHSQRTAYVERAKTQTQRLGLPRLPTTTIGSFPQTSRIRSTRAAYRAGKLPEADYVSEMREEIADTIALQERLGLDVLVHGEPERNDMVQYFAEALEGFASTKAGWVQSYGSRCVRPPILYGDVSRKHPITVDWSSYAQSLTAKPVKGMLTGPVTILAWSFVRDDQPLSDTARQVALALRDEVRDLEAAGIRLIQVDEPALRETLPPRRTDHAAYLEWAVEAFRLATGGVGDSTQIHTHLCYSEFGDVIDAIAALDADVTSIEASRSHMEVLEDLARAGYAQGVGPGVYDIHSPRIPAHTEVERLLEAALRAVPADRLWVNPDCGLKTRDYSEVEPSLKAMVAAAKSLRERVD